MSLHVLCLTSGGGLPLFTRRKGEDETLPYSIIGSLNGVHMFSKSHNIEMLHTSANSHNVVWKEFHESVVIIAISTGSTVPVLNALIETVFNAMVLVIGIDEIKTQRNIERLKRELKAIYPILDRLLDSVDYGDSSNNSTDLIGMSESILCPENHLIQIVLNSLAECVDSMYACILIHGKIGVATENWWTLHPNERKLLSLLGSLEHDSTAKDYHIFLPYTSPNAALRLASCTLIPDVVVCSLLGSTPTLDEVEQTVCQCFKTIMEILRSAETVFPRNFPNSIELDTGILGFLLIDFVLNKYVLSRNLQQSTNKLKTTSHRLDTLRTFYYQAVLNFLITNQDSDNSIDNENNRSNNATETYWCSEYHKCHAFKNGDNLLCVLYTSSIPTHTMRALTQKSLKNFITDKQLCW